MVRKSHIFTSFCCLTLALTSNILFYACTDDEIVDTKILVTDGQIGFNASYKKTVSQSTTRMPLKECKPSFRIESSDGELSIDVSVKEGIDIPECTYIKTRGVQITDVGDWSYNVSAYYDDPVNGLRSYFRNNPNGIEIASNSGVFTSNYYWPQRGNMSFEAYAPSGNNDVTVSENGNKLVYTIPEKVENQKDVMVARMTVDCSNRPETVNLNFEHLFAAVQFKVGDMQFIRINSLTMSGVKGGEITMTYDSDNEEWKYSASENNISYSPIYTTNGVPNFDTSGLPKNSFIAGGDNGLTMLVMPQTIGQGVTLTLNYTQLIDNKTQEKEVVFNGSHNWVAGQTSIYSVNIGTDVKIEIPTPPDADAHYVRIDMSYDLTGLSEYEENGIAISNIMAKAEWLDDGSNTASNDKQSIFLKTTLTNMQQQGFFTDELWEVRYSVGNDGKKSYTVGSENGPERVDDNILGTSTLSLTKDSKGVIYLFLDENNGTSARNGKLEITATVNQNGTSRSVVLGKGDFKQLCPSWGDDGIGVERFEDDENYPFGFSYNRVVIYTNTQTETYQQIVERLGEFAGAIYRFILWLFGALADEVIPDTEGIAEGFVVVEKYNDFIKTITLDYGALNTVASIASAEDGLANTRTLYNYTGATDIAELENQFDETLSDWDKKDDESGANPTDYAAFIALTRNRMREVHTIVSSSEGTTPTYEVILHKENEGNGTDGVNETGVDIIEWYLPSIVEAQNLKETGTGMETTPISSLDGTYWSSTAGEDPDAGGIENGYAYSFKFSNNVYSSYNPSEDRSTKLRIRAVRKQ